MTGLLSILDKTGDTRLQWDKTNPPETEAARLKFDEFRAKGYAAFKTTAAGEKGESLNSFDPHAERIILMPPMVGG